MLQRMYVPVCYPDIIPSVALTVHLDIDQVQLPVSIVIVSDAPKLFPEFTIYCSFNFRN